MPGTGSYTVKRGEFVNTKAGIKIMCPYCGYAHDEDVAKHGDSLFCHNCSKVFIVPQDN